MPKLQKLVMIVFDKKKTQQEMKNKIQFDQK